MQSILNTYVLGDMKATYLIDEDTKNVEFVLLPAAIEYKNMDDMKEKPYIDSAVQVKIMGDTYNGGYAPGVTMRQSPSVVGFKYKDQTVKIVEDTTEIDTILEDSRGYLLCHHLKYTEGEKVIRTYSSFKNNSDKEVSLESISSFSLGKISPLMDGDGADTLKLHRIRSVWSMEGRKETLSLEDLQLEPSWGGHAVRCERFGSIGSLPVNKFFPIMVLEDSKNQIFWGVQLMHNASWQMEVYRRGDYVQISGGLADREYGHWTKNIKSQEEFVSPEAIISVCRDEEEEVYRRLTSSLNSVVNEGPKSEQSLPVMFNEYCTTWGNPSHENICEIVNTIKDKGFEYFVIDCGWYKQEGIPWDVSMGDYEVSKELFKDGLDKTVQVIKDAGMKPGIWFEIDNVGEKSKAYNDTEHLLKRDGYPLTTTMRRFWDLRQEHVQEYLREKVIGTLKQYGFEYMKIDCNDTVGIGCDGAESLGEGLRQNQEYSIKFIQKVKEEIPGIILENCASGGHKLEPLMMSLCSMASFSDAHECPEIPIIAANLHRVILPRQSQIWAVIRQEDSLKRIAYSIANTFLGRMCLSGDVCSLDEPQWKVIDDGISFYKKIASIIKDGKTYFYGNKISSYRHPKGWQAIFRESIDESKAYIVIHGFNQAKGVQVQINLNCDYHLVNYYSYQEEHISLKNGALEYRIPDDMYAVCLYLEKDS
ncbi:glycoside hydrolase family 36 protein [Pseudobutyrivibrio ruminis]|uniref:Alpha-galactosidase n=1 Tax=Pseudobutyrivibrio ruminis DSM 9787 TaxID=1123011 RepID=A0A285SXY5_9FIRM|nr:glycoside hydrolase family 36 protein [Pseudobutyrivibrio ruminis]SOC13157.1 alpha-galactosidase [Pseudobutyrivibrio ruminis DSM 9787]